MQEAIYRLWFTEGRVLLAEFFYLRLTFLFIWAILISIFFPIRNIPIHWKKIQIAREGGKKTLQRIVNYLIKITLQNSASRCAQLKKTSISKEASQNNASVCIAPRFCRVFFLVTKFFTITTTARCDCLKNDTGFTW